MSYLVNAHIGRNSVAEADYFEEIDLDAVDLLDVIDAMEAAHGDL
jgi:hypothetical protein